MVEFRGDVARQLNVLFLILTNRNVGCVIDQNVSRHQRGIGVEAQRGLLSVLAGLVLELGHAVQPAHAGHAVEHPGQLAVCGNLALIEQHRFCRVQAAGKVGGCKLTRGVAQIGGVLEIRSDRVLVNDAIDRFHTIILHGNKALQSAQVVAKLQVVGRLNAGKDAWREAGHR